MQLFKDRRVKKVLFLVAIVFVLAGCTANLDANGAIKPDRVIDNSTPWTLSQGWFDFLIVMPIAKLMLWIEGFAGIVASVIIVTILMNLLTLPLMVKSTVMSQKMQALQPQMERIQNKYRGRNDQASKARMSAEISNLYSKNGVKMGQTMLLPFLSFPIMIAVWQAVQRIPSVYEATFIGLNFGEMPMNMITQGQWGYLVLIIVMALFQFISMQIPQFLQKRSKNYRAPKNGNKSMILMNVYMMIIIVMASLNMPSAMSVYWIVTSIIAIIRSVYIHYRHTVKI